MRKLFAILMTLIACCWSAQAQTRTYHGTVLDAANNEPLIGATVRPIGGGQGAAADFDGHFTVTVPASVKKAEFTYVGYTPVTLDLHDGMTVKLNSSDTTLEDVVVVAYGTSTKEALTGSVAVVGSKEIEDRPVTSVTAALEGNAPGVQVNNSTGTPGSAPNIRIRGFNSLGGANSPLYVVDGVPMSGSPTDLNPADVESMSVLKDAASCALYGNRGANGVILITTKKAKKAGKVDVTLQVRQGMYNRGLPMYDRLDPNDWMQTAFTGMVNGYQVQVPTATHQDAIDYYRQNFISGYAKTNIYGGYDPNDVQYDDDGNATYGNRVGFLNNELFDATGRFIPTDYLPGYRDNLDWWDVVSRSGYRQEYNVNAAAATDRFNIFASAGYLKENGYMLQTDYERFNGRLNANFNPTSYLRFGLNLAATSSNSETGQTGDDLGHANNPFLTMGYAPIYSYYAHDWAGNVLMSEGSPVWSTATWLQGDNVAWAQRLDKNDYSDEVIDANIYGTAVIPYGFELTVRGAMWRDKTHSRSYMNSTVGSAIGVGRLYETFSSARSHTFMQTLNWTHDYGNNHVEVLLDHENYQATSQQSSVNVDTEVFPDMLYLSNFENTNPASESKGEVRTESYLGRARYNWDQKYFAEASFRRDGTSKFHKDTRWGNFWSVGASWIITRENFMQNLHWLDNLKLRVAYGSVGNDAAAGTYAYYSLYGIANYINTKTLIPTSLASYNTKWESTKTLDVALEGNLWNDRFRFSVGYFNKRNADLLYNVTQPCSAGTTANTGYNPTILTNIGTMQNIGWELQFGVDIIRNREFQWDFSIDATFLKNKIVKLPFGRDIPGAHLFEGYSLYEQYVVPWAGVDQLTGRSLYEINGMSPDYMSWREDGTPYQNEDLVNADILQAQADGSLVMINGKYYTYNPNFAGRKRAGTALPTVYGSFGTNLSWKGFTLSMLFTYSLGGKTLDSVYAGLMSMSGQRAGAMHKDILGSWVAAPEGMTADSPNRIDPNGIPQVNSEHSLYNNHSESTRWLVSSSSLTMKNINLTYDFPKKWIDALQLQNLNLGVSIDNLFIIAKRKGMNPQYGFAGGQGMNYVPARVFSFQLGVKF